MNEIEIFKLEMKNGLSIEEMQALYFNQDALRLQPRRVYRIGGTAKRIYYTLNEADEPYFYSSVTTAIARNIPTSEHLIKWMAEMGLEEAETYKQERADYGTFLHIECSSLLINRKLDLDGMEDRLLAYMDERKLPTSFIYHAEELRKDVLAFAQFVIDYKVKPLAIEIILASEALGMAGAIDMPCEMTITEKGFFGEVYKTGVNKGTPKESKRETVVRAIVDFKSGRKGFYTAHECQLKIYEKLWNENFPDLPVDKLFNWAPNEWRGGTPTYKLKDQTTSEGAEMADLIIQLEKLKRKRDNRGILVTQGEIVLDGGDLRENYYSVELGEFVKGKHNERG